MAEPLTEYAVSAKKVTSALKEAVASNHVVVVSEIAECSIFVELLGAIVGVEQELEVIVTDVAAGGVNGLEREACTVAKTGANSPAGLLFESGGAGR
ncbi:hypothetical protein TMatcc_003736 [Talaromyces marneffei ATCC 18224]